MNNAMHTHLNEDELVLHYYGEMSAGDEARAAAHLRDVQRLPRRATRKLQRVLAAVDSGAAGRSCRRLRAHGVGAPRARARSSSARGWISGSCSPRAARLGGRDRGPGRRRVLRGARVAAGRPGAGTQTATAAAVRERILLVDLSDHLDRSQMVLVELVSAGGDGGVDISAERARAEELVADNRLYRQTAVATGDMALATVLDELERVLVDVAASPDATVADDLERVRQRHRKPRDCSSRCAWCRRRFASGRRPAIRMRTGKSSGSEIKRLRDRVRTAASPAAEETGYRIMSIRQSRVCSIVFAGTLILAGSALAQPAAGGETPKKIQAADRFEAPAEAGAPPTSSSIWALKAGSTGSKSSTSRG